MSSRRVFILGGHTTPFIGRGHPLFKSLPKGQKPQPGDPPLNPNIQEHMRAAVQGALSASKVKAEAIDKSYVANFAGELFVQQGHLGAGLTYCDPGFRYKPAMRVEGACASGGLAACAGVESIKAGNDLALVVGAEVQTSASPRDGASYLGRAADYANESSIDGFIFPCIFARRTKHYLEKYPDASPRDLAKVAAKAYANGNLNPKAHMTKVKVTEEQAMGGEKNPKFLGNEEFKDYLRLTDCSQVSDGASAIILASEEGIKKAGLSVSDCVEVIGSEYGIGDLFSHPPDFASMDTAKAVVSRLYKNTGKSIKDVDVGEVHDCFSMAEIMMYEAIGLAEPGKGVNVIREGITHLDGKLPINTGGGLIAWGHPVGATGVKQIHEVFRQMKGQCEDYQMKKQPNIGITVNMGGEDKTIASLLLENK